MGDVELFTVLFRDAIQELDDGEVNGIECNHWGMPLISVVGDAHVPGSYKVDW